MNGHTFELDRFQVDAIAALDRGENVLVAAPTGAGKTVVAEHAVLLALRSGGKAFYTAPIKALSNQKYHDLVAQHGTENVGLLTGDTSRNPDAPVVVMTTEVLRNMLYRAAPALDGLRFVVLDEVHFLQDEYRGPVWEEVIIHLASDVRLVCLSATVSNAHELGEWITTVRGPTSVIVETTRPVRLTNHFVIDERGRDHLTVIPTLVGGKPNSEGARFDQGGAQRGKGSGPTPPRGRARRPFFTPRRLDVVEVLARRDLLPAIYFIFSRAACDDAVTACVDAGIRLTTTDERDRVMELAAASMAVVDDADLAVLGYDRFVRALAAGVAAHHAGMIPPFKEAVEACFAEGLVKVVFATETLALGINMPARSVVIEKLTKFTGERHEFLTPGQYTQLTGRAGRRGIDPEGHALVLWSPFVPFESVANLAASRRFVLTSSFRPTYNMAANLVQRYDRADAHRLLNLSFAQFQADKEVVRLEVELEDRRHSLDRARRRLVAATGDARTADSLVGQAAAWDDRGEDVGADPDPTAVEAFARLNPGDVVELPGVAAAPPSAAAVLSVAHRGSTVRLRVITGDGAVRRLDPSDVRGLPEVVGAVRLPVPFAPQNPAFQEEVARRLRRATLRRRDGSIVKATHDGLPAPSAVGDPAELARRLNRVVRLERVVKSAEARVDRRTQSLARRFDRLLGLLSDWGYIEGWVLTERGERLAGLYHECDLLLAEALSVGLMDGLDEASLAGLLSCLTYEHRSPVPPPEPWFPSAAVRRRVTQLTELALRLAADEKRAGLPQTRPPDAGFFALAHAWTAGVDLETVLEDEQLSPGDFVRNTKQLLDLLRQVAGAAPTHHLAETARRATDAMLRGVVLASSVVGEVDAL